MNRQGAKDAKTRERMDGLATVVVDAALTVHRALGPGFLENVYQEALSVELDARRVPFARQVSIGVRYRDVPVGKSILDLLVDDLLVPLALLLNFNVRYMRDGIRRIILSEP